MKKLDLRRPTYAAAFAMLLGAGGCVSTHQQANLSLPPAPLAPTAAPPAAEAVFDNAAPASVAPRLASECTRRRMALVRNTPEQVVCKYQTRVESESPRKMIAELWTFVLTPSGQHQTKVEGRSSYESSTSKGYAEIAIAEQTGDSPAAMRAFLEDVRRLNGLRGPTQPGPVRGG